MKMKVSLYEEKKFTAAVQTIITNELKSAELTTPIDSTVIAAALENEDMPKEVSHILQKRLSELSSGDALREFITDVETALAAPSFLINKTDITAALENEAIPEEVRSILHERLSHPFFGEAPNFPDILNEFIADVETANDRLLDVAIRVVQTFLYDLLKN